MTLTKNFNKVPIITSNSSTNEDRQNNRNVINEKTIGWKEPTKLGLFLFCHDTFSNAVLSLQKSFLN